jgi:uncharacterized phage protein gp47/JayE
MNREVYSRQAREDWHRLDAERAAALKRHMRHPATTLNGVLKRMHDDGEVWLRELGERRHLPNVIADLTELVTLIGQTTVPNMMGLLRAGALTLEEAVAGALGAGIGTGLFLGVDRERSRVLGILDDLDDAFDEDPEALVLLGGIRNRITAAPEE